MGWSNGWNYGRAINVSTGAPALAAWGAGLSLSSYLADCFAHREVKEPTLQGAMFAMGIGALFGGMGGNGFQYPGKLAKGALALTVKNATILSIKSAAVSGGVRIIQTGLSKLMNHLSNGEWSKWTGLNVKVGLKSQRQGVSYL